MVGIVPPFARFGASESKAIGLISHDWDFLCMDSPRKAWMAGAAAVITVVFSIILLILYRVRDDIQGFLGPVSTPTPLPMPLPGLDTLIVLGSDGFTYF